ncbi:sensor histidine kinase [Cryptosporangium minutisporangium]|uniref:Signal transduction histidine kinase subgroup 3 dimerisation and phosphoacceptor domain-containing protein n=1 Tax=Cryptosporangium minutisporangium TaxID=113569 RepID=A0ABP6T198_9ACTN
MTGSLIAAMVVGSGFAAGGAVATTRRPRSGPAWVLVVVAALLLGAPAAAAFGADRAAGLLVLTAAVVLPCGVLRIVPRRRLRRVQRGLDLAVLAGGVVTVGAVAFGAEPLGSWTAGLVVVLVFCAGWLQFELTSGDERRQVLWLVAGVAASVPPTALFGVWADDGSLSGAAISVIIGVLLLPVPLSATIALVAPRWTAVRAVISHATVAATMFLVAVAVYSGGEALARILTGEVPPLTVRAMLAALVAAGFAPVLARVRAASDELLFGGRSDPVDTLTRLGTELTAGSAPTEWLETLRSALGVPGIVLRRGSEVVASSGRVDPARCATTPLRAGPEHVGDLDVGIPADQLALSSATRNVVQLVAAPLAQALHAIRLSAQLQASRGRVVAALEEERRRVRRDLHDGLGPALTGIAYSADAARNLLTVDAVQAEQILRELRTDAGEAIAEVRRIVYGMRPRALDELGLVEAVRQRVLQLPGAEGRALSVTIVAGSLPDLPAAVEVTAYRVAVEAVTNVARHAGVGEARVEFVPDGRCLRLTVRDDGRSDGPWSPGVGLTSMRERVEQIGGVLTAGAGPDGGVVAAELPLDVYPTADTVR